MRQMMKDMRYRVLCAMMLATAVSFSSCEQEPIPTPDEPQIVAPYVEGEVIVKFTAEVADMIAQSEATRGAATRSGVVAVDEVLEAIEGYDLERVFPIDERTEERTREQGLHQWYVVRFGAACTAEQVAERLAGLGEVQAVDFNRSIKRAYRTKATPLSVSRLAAAESATRATAEAMNDPLLAAQWHLVNRGDQFCEGGLIKSVRDADVQCEGAWQRSTGNEQVIVAVLDEGVFVDHPDLKANIWVNEDEVWRSRDDNDGNGYAGDRHGYNFVKSSGVISWNDVNDSGHGSHVAGVISAVNNNGVGISSIAGGSGAGDGVKIMVCQIFSGYTGSNALAVVRAIKYAADNGAVVLQCSWGYVSGAANTYDWGEQGFASQEEWEAGAPLEKSALDYFTHNAGSPNGPIEGGIAIFAGGNESAPMAGYPGASDDYISVAATAADFTAATYTNYGKGTSVSAPGGDQDYYYDYVDEDHNFGEVGCVLSTLPYNVSESGYGYMEGTSMACPHVSGVAALAISYAAEHRRHLTEKELRELLISTSTPIDEFQTGSKTYSRYVADIGPLQPMQMNLSAYRGQMGAGQVNADALLAAIEGAGRELRFPNLYLDVEGSMAVVPSRYFAGGEELTYKVAIDDPTIAKVTAEGAKLIFKGISEGSTTARIAASNGTVHTFTITVRRGANSNGWL